MADPGDHLGGTPEGSDTTVPLFRYCKVTKTYVRRPGYIQASSAAEAEELKRNMARAMLTHTTFDHTQQPHFTKDKRSSSGSIFIKNTKRARTTPAPRAAPQIPPELLPYLLDESEHVRADIGSSTPSGTTRGFSDGGEAFTGDFGDDGGFLFTGHDAPNKPAAASQPSRRAAQDAKWAENFESLVETGKACVAQIGQLFCDARESRRAWLESRAEKEVPQRLPPCGDCQGAWKVHGNEKFTVDLLAFDGRFTMSLPLLSCGGQRCSPRRIHPLELGCWPVNPTALSQAAQQVRWIDIRLLELFSLLVCFSPKETSARGTAEVYRRFWLEQESWGVPNAHDHVPTTLDPRVLSDAHSEYMNFKLVLSDPSAHLLSRDTLYPGPVKCPACRYTVQTVSTDGCYKFPQFASAATEGDAALNPATAHVTHFLDARDVQAAVKNKAQAPPADGDCPNAFRAANPLCGRKGGNFARTGVAICVCRHGTTSVACDMFSGERFDYGDKLHGEVFRRCISNGVPLHGMFYDINCKYFGHLQRTFPDELAALSALSGEEVKGAVGRMHINMHSAKCQQKYSSVAQNMGLQSGEEPEFVWSLASRLGLTLKYVSAAKRRAILDLFLTVMRDTREVTLPDLLVRMFQRAVFTRDTAFAQLKGAQPILEADHVIRARLVLPQDVSMEEYLAALYSAVLQAYPSAQAQQQAPPSVDKRTKVRNDYAAALRDLFAAAAHTGNVNLRDAEAEVQRIEGDRKKHRHLGFDNGVQRWAENSTEYTAQLAELQTAQKQSAAAKTEVLVLELLRLKGERDNNPSQAAKIGKKIGNKRKKAVAALTHWYTLQALRAPDSVEDMVNGLIPLPWCQVRSQATMTLDAAIAQFITAYQEWRAAHTEMDIVNRELHDTARCCIDHLEAAKDAGESLQLPLAGGETFTKVEGHVCYLRKFVQAKLWLHARISKVAPECTDPATPTSGRGANVRSAAIPNIPAELVKILRSQGLILGGEAQEEHVSDSDIVSSSDSNSDSEPESDSDDD